MLHHKVKNFETQLDVFRDITVAQAVITNPLTAAEEIDRVLGEMFATQRPGYIEIPRDMVDVLILDNKAPLQVNMPPVHAKRLELAVNETLDLLASAKNPIAMAGLMAVRRHLDDALRDFVEHLGIPMATTSLSRGVLSERHPMSLGVYMGAVSPTAVVEQVEQAEPLITFGVPFADLVMGGFTHHIDQGHLIECTDTQVNIGYHSYLDVPLWAFLPALIKAAGERNYHRHDHGIHHVPTFAASSNTPLSVERVMECVSSVIHDGYGLLIEPGDSLFASVELPSPAWALSSAYYATMGYAVPAAIGAGLADPKRRPLILVGDGAFLMTGLELLSALHHGIKPIVVIADNGGYGTQRPMLDGHFNDIPTLHAENLPAIFGTGQGFRCETEEQLHDALLKSVASDELSIIRALIPKGKYSPALIRLTDALRKKI